MNIKSLFSGSAVALFAISGARAADNPVAAEPEKPAEYVRVCEVYGQGYFYIPGTETCMRISGYVRGDIKAGDDVYARQFGKYKRDTYAWHTRAALDFQTASETEIGTLRSFVELRAQWDSGAEFGDGHDQNEVHFAFIELGGLRIGLDESIFNYWTGYFGNVLNDDILTPLAFSRTSAISYTFSSGNGFSAILGLEQGNSKGDDEGFRYDDNGGKRKRNLRQQIDDYTPHIIAGVKYAQGWGGIAAVAAYDAYYSEWAARMRFDVNLNDQFSLWAMGAYKSMQDYYKRDKEYPNSERKKGIYRQINSIYGDWGGHWAVWGGGTYKLTPQTNFNFQLAYEAAKTFSSSVNLEYELVPGLTITPELTYISWNDKYGYRSSDGLKDWHTSLKGKDAFQGMVRLQRSF